MATSAGAIDALAARVRELLKVSALLHHRLRDYGYVAKAATFATSES
jgi:hypothetical protein